MKKILRYRICRPAFGCMFLLAMFAGGPALMAQSSNETPANSLTIFVVRHAEKDTADKVNPVLSPLGEARAKDLCQVLAPQMPQQVFSTNTRRTVQTAACLGLTPQIYDARQLSVLVQKVTGLSGQGPVLIVGHSNTVLETVEAFTGKKPLARLDDEDYDYLFELKWDKGQWQILTRQYGAPHRAKPGQENRMQ